MFDTIAKINKGVHSNDGVWGRDDGFDKGEIVKGLEDWHNKTHWSMDDIEFPMEKQYSMSGYKFYTNKKRLGFGFSMGAVYTPFTWYHELAHCLEFVNNNESERLLDSISHCFNYPEVELLGNVYNEPTTSQGVYRELRTFAIQLKLMEKDFPNDTIDYDLVKSFVDPLKYTTDFVNVKGDSEADKIKVCTAWCYGFYKGLSDQHIEDLYSKTYNLLKGKFEILRDEEDTWYDDIVL